MAQSLAKFDFMRTPRGERGGSRKLGCEKCKGRRDALQLKTNLMGLQLIQLRPKFVIQRLPFLADFERLLGGLGMRLAEPGQDARFKCRLFDSTTLPFLLHAFLFFFMVSFSLHLPWSTTFFLCLIRNTKSPAPAGE